MPYISFKLVFSFFSFPTLYDGIGVERVKYLSRKQESQERQEGEKDKNSKKKNPPKRERITLLAFFRICFPFPSNVIPPHPHIPALHLFLIFFAKVYFPWQLLLFQTKLFTRRRRQHYHILYTFVVLFTVFLSLKCSMFFGKQRRGWWYQAWIF